MSVSARKHTPDEHRKAKSAGAPHGKPISLERALLKRLLAGDSAAQAELFRRHRGSLWRQALKVVGNPALADEVVQEGWINGMQALHTFAGRSTFATWITAVVLNEARGRRKREARSLPLSGLGPGERRIGSRPDDWRTDSLEKLAGADVETPERLLLEKETNQRFQRALQSLSPTQRAVLVLRDLHGTPPARTCDVLRLTDLAQRIQLCRARARIRRVLQQDDAERATG